MFIFYPAMMTSQFEKRCIEMTELEKVEKLREKANVTFAEAKEALNNSGGDILDALIYLENQGKVTVPASGGFYSGADLPVPAEHVSSGNGENKNHNSGSHSPAKQRNQPPGSLVKM